MNPNAEDSMTDKTPPYKPNVDRAVANAARLHDIVSRARLATPITADTGRDILLGRGHGSMNLRSTDD